MVTRRPQLFVQFIILFTRIIMMIMMPYRAYQILTADIWILDYLDHNACWDLSVNLIIMI